MSKTTKAALGRSLKNMLLKKPLNKVTITDITEDCGVNRMTFYYHFKDIYDLLEWIWKEDAEQILEGKRSRDTWQEGFLSLCRLVLDNKVFVTNVYHCVSREHLETQLYRLAEEFFMDVIDELSQDVVLEEKDKEFIAAFYKYAFVGIILNWIDHNMKEDPEEMVHNLGLLVEGDIVNAIQRFAKKNSQK